MTSREFIYKLPSKVSREAIADIATIFHFDFEGEGGGQFTVRLDKGTVNVSDGLHGEPECVVRSTNDDFMKLLRGELNPMMAILTGKVKISNQSAMLKYAKIF